MSFGPSRRLRLGGEPVGRELWPENLPGWAILEDLHTETLRLARRAELGCLHAFEHHSFYWGDLADDVQIPHQAG